MSILERKEIVEEGDWVVLYEGFGSIKSAQIKKGASLQNKSGVFFHNDMIGRKYGSRITSGSKTAGKGDIIIFHPTPQLWTEVLNHRTQILFQTDISLVLHHLDLKPGSVIIESGTGSGSLTTSLARAVAPFGHVHSFEFNLDRVNKAKADFTQNGLNDVITVRHRDVCGSGFPYFPDGADAVFLDLPSPWVVLDDCHRNLRPQGRICSFSPCIEQVQRVCVRLDELGYEDIFTIEVLTKGTEVHQSRLQECEMQKLFNQLPEVFKSPRSTKKSTVTTTESSDMNENDSESNHEEGPNKKIKRTVSTDDTVVITSRADLHAVQVKNPTLITKPYPTMRGHTGYLTFARKPSKTVISQTATEVETMVNSNVSASIEEAEIVDA